jgi:ribosomal protein L30E
MNLEDIKKLISEGKTCLGTESTLKNLRLGKLSKVLISNNCPENVKEDINSWGTEVEIIQVDQNNEKLGIICKKTFHISVIGVLKV